MKQRKWKRKDHVIEYPITRKEKKKGITHRDSRRTYGRMNKEMSHSFENDVGK